MALAWREFEPEYKFTPHEAFGTLPQQKCGLSLILTTWNLQPSVHTSSGWKHQHEIRSTRLSVIFVSRSLPPRLFATFLFFSVYSNFLFSVSSFFHLTLSLVYIYSKVFICLCLYFTLFIHSFCLFSSLCFFPPLYYLASLLLRCWSRGLSYEEFVNSDFVSIAFA